jgi:hypothetical protein
LRYRRWHAANSSAGHRASRRGGQDQHGNGQQVLVGLQVGQDLQASAARQVEIEHDQGRPGSTGEAARPAEKLHGLVAVAHYVRADGRVRLLERLCDQDDIPWSSSTSRTSTAFLPVPSSISGPPRARPPDRDHCNRSWKRLAAANVTGTCGGWPSQSVTVQAPACWLPGRRAGRGRQPDRCSLREELWRCAKAGKCERAVRLAGPGQDQERTAHGAAGNLKISATRVPQGPESARIWLATRRATHRP